jgi:hypothetical protein
MRCVWLPIHSGRHLAERSTATASPSTRRTYTRRWLTSLTDHAPPDSTHVSASDVVSGCVVGKPSIIQVREGYTTHDTALVSKISNSYQVERIAVRVASTMPSIPTMLALSRTVEGAPIPAVNAPAGKSPRGRSLKCVRCAKESIAPKVGKSQTLRASG